MKLFSNIKNMEKKESKAQERKEHMARKIKVSSKTSSQPELNLRKFEGKKGMMKGYGPKYA